MAFEGEERMAFISISSGLRPFRTTKHINKAYSIIYIVS